MANTFGKLDHLTVKGYKSIQSVDRLPLGDINIIIGANGAGKSNFVSLFRLLSRLAREELQDYVVKQGGLDRLLFFGPKVSDHLEIGLEAASVLYRAVLVPTAHQALMFDGEWINEGQQWREIGGRGRTETGLIDKRLPRSSRTGRMRIIRNWMLDWRVYHFHDTSDFSPLRASAPLTEPERLAADGGNLPAFLYYLQEQHPDRLEMLLDTVRLVAPFFGGFVLRPEALNKDLIRLRWRHQGRDNLFDVADLSDGTLRFIALAALLLQPEPPETIVLDEPELGLHPAAVTQLAALMQQVSAEVQIIAATQSPTFANHFGWQDFIVVDRVDDASRFRRLTAEEVAPWADEFGMGEAWEKNLIGGRP
ncbi:AAA family ATPase [Asticcacaulis sp.]|uniref:AAA family ATPase n=1 Tax=Asticcacaulis sp. TaxID=1872648 RepID=UPI00262806CA|nr:AAA family ATPase [Asticcacaulis sp.]